MARRSDHDHRIRVIWVLVSLVASKNGTASEMFRMVLVKMDGDGGKMTYPIFRMEEIELDSDEESTSSAASTVLLQDYVVRRIHYDYGK